MSRDINLSLIDPDPEQPRKHFDPAALDELAQSMQADGLAVAILLRPVGERFVIVHGERRWRAAQLLGWEAIPADVRDLTPEAALWLAFLENVQRADLTPIEEATFFQARLAEGLTQSELGKRIGKSQQYVADRLALLRLEPVVQDMITARAVSPSVGRRLATVEDPKLQISLAHAAADERQTVKKIEGKIAQVEGRKKTWDLAEFDRWGSGELSFARLVETDPDMAYYRPGIERGEFKFNHIPPRVHIQNLTHPLTDQPAPYPRYSGVGFARIEPDYLSGSFAEDWRLPLFTEAEWGEFIDFNEDSAMEWWIMEHLPGLFCEYHRRKDDFYPLCEHTRAALRRSYEPGHGRLLVATEEECPCDVRNPYFVRRGWGHWRAVEFNDGEGGREQRRVFLHDDVTFTLINEVYHTLDTDVFSDQNFRELALWGVQPVGMSWYYIRRKTIPKEDAIAALEADLARLKETEPLTEEALNEQVLDRLQAYTHLNLGIEWREGNCSYPRRDDGTVDAALFNELIDRFNRAEAAAGRRERSKRRKSLTDA